MITIDNMEIIENLGHWEHCITVKFLLMQQMVTEGQFIFVFNDEILN